MKLDNPINPNYAAVVVTIKSVVALPNCDNVASAPMLGYTAIVSKDTKVGDVGIMFPPEVQLSDEFCRENNLYRHTEKNKDPLAKGYIEDNRRVKAVKFRGHTSNALFMSLSSLKYTGAKLGELTEGEEFDVINKHSICCKYVLKVRAFTGQQPKKRISRVDAIHMPEHYDTENYFRWADNILPEQDIIVTQKLHGTSIRIGNIVVKRKLNPIEWLLSKVGVGIKLTEYDYIYASRKVIKDPNNPFQKDFYETDIWTEEGKKLRGLLPHGYILYGELVGWTSTGMPIQKDYTYGLPTGTAELYVYRMAIVNDRGFLSELSWDHTVETCKGLGLKTVQEIWRGKHKDFDAVNYMDMRLCTLDERCKDVGEKFVDEGVCIRIDTVVPKIYKAKSPIFLEHESKMLDESVVDLEATQSDSIQSEQQKVDLNENRE